MIAFNLSVDFEMGWGDLERLAADDMFYRRVVEGNTHVAEVIQLLGPILERFGAVHLCRRNSRRAAIDGMSPQHFPHCVRLAFAQYHGRVLSRGLNVLEKIWQID
jgi:hypothetical protein